MDLPSNTTYQNPVTPPEPAKVAPPIAPVPPAPAPEPVTGPAQYQGLVEALQPAVNLPIPTPESAPVPEQMTPSPTIIQDLTNRLQSLYKQYSSPF